MLTPEMPPTKKALLLYKLSGKTVFTVLIPAVRMLLMVMPTRVMVMRLAPVRAAIA